MKLRIGFAGIGAMGLSHLQAMHQELGTEAQAVAVCSGNAANIQRAREIAPEVRVYETDEDLITSDVDAVFISSPNFKHVPLAAMAIQADKHVFLEKPVGVGAEECHRLLELSKRTDRVVMVGHELRYSPYFQRVKELLDGGAIGRPWLVWCREFRGPFQKKSRDWIQDQRYSGGALVDKNCHHFDLMNWWLGTRPSFVSGFGGNAVERVIPGPNQVLDHATVTFEYENGARGSLQLCMFAPDLEGEDLELGVIGERGLLQTRLSRLEIVVRKRNVPEPEIHSVEAKRGLGWGGHLGFSEIHEAFLSAVRGESKPLTGVSDCIDGTLLAIAAEKAIKEKRIVEIKHGAQHD